MQWQVFVKPSAREVTPSLTLPTNLSLFCFGFFCQILLIWDAIRMRNNIQIVAVCLQNLGLLIYAGIQRGQVRRVVDIMKEARDRNNESIVNLDMDIWGSIGLILLLIPCIIGAGSVILGAIAFKVIEEFSWTTYKKLHGDLNMKRRLLAFQVKC